MNEKDEAAGALIREKILDEKLERAAKTAASARQCAWESLKQTRNPEYVSLRYGIPVEKLRAAMAQFPDEEPLYKKLARRGYHSARDADDGELDAAAPPPGREPGEDDGDE